MLDLISLIVSIFALILAFYAIIYTHWFNRIKISVAEVTYEKLDDINYISFAIHNFSTIPVEVESIILSSMNQKDLIFTDTHNKILPYIPDELDNSRILPSSSKTCLGVYTDNVATPMIVSLNIKKSKLHLKSKVIRSVVTVKDFYQ